MGSWKEIGVIEESKESSVSETKGIRGRAAQMGLGGNGAWARSYSPSEAMLGHLLYKYEYYTVPKYNGKPLRILLSRGQRC